MAFGVGSVVAVVDLDRTRRLAPHAVAGVSAFGAALATAEDVDVRGAPWVVASALLLGVPDRETEAHPLGRWVLPMALVSLVGVWVSVPDTQAPLAVGAAVAPLAMLRYLRDRSVGPPATTALVVAVLGAVWVGSAGWGAALAEVALVAQVLVAPLVSGFVAVDRPNAARRTLVVAHLVVVAALPRWVMFRSVPIASAIAAGAMLASAAVAGLVEARWPGSGVRRSGVGRW